MKRIQRLRHDEWGRSEVYFASWGNSEHTQGMCLFATLDPAIFYVISMLGRDIVWSKFPDKRKKYPYEDRDGSNHNLNPVFIAKQRTRDGREVFGSVQKMTAADVWIVGNGIAEDARRIFFEATGRDIVKLSGVGDKFQGRVGRRSRK